jgi:uncharacterized small protein (DUF1192 family)
MHQVLSGHTERQEMPGLVALVSHRDDVHVETLGTLSFDNPAPMKRDTVFRVASITKLVTAVAAMILVEDCKIRLGESIESRLEIIFRQLEEIALFSTPDVERRVAALRAQKAALQAQIESVEASHTAAY